jgi:hypothetical protein
MTLQKSGVWTTNSTDDQPDYAKSSWNDFANANTGFLQNPTEPPEIEYGRGFFAAKNSCYLAFGPLGIQRDATIKEVSLAFKSSRTSVSGGDPIPIAPDFTPTCNLFLMQSDGFWDAQSVEGDGEVGAYLIGKPAIEFSIATRIGTSGTSDQYGTSVRTPLPSVTAANLETNFQSIVNFGQTFQSTSDVTLSNGGDTIGMMISRTGSGDTTGTFHFRIYEVTPDAADGAPPIELGDASYIARTGTMQLSALPTGAPAFVDLPLTTILGGPLVQGKWYMITLNYFWQAITSHQQIKYQVYSETVPGVAAANNDGTSFGMVQDWWQLPAVSKPPAYGFNRNGYPTPSQFPAMSLSDNSRTGNQFGTEIGPFTALADVGEVNIVAEGFADVDPPPTANVTGLVSNIQAWIEDPQYDPTSLGRNLCLVLDESDSTPMVGNFDTQRHLIFQSDGGGLNLPILQIRYEIPGGGQALRYRSFEVEPLVQSRGIEIEPRARSRGLVVES